MIAKHLSIFNFSGVYTSQPGFCDLADSIQDCTGIRSSDCYCDDDAQKQILELLGSTPANGIHFVDSGNYHYMSKLTTDSISENFNLLVFDHHPDMQPPRFEGILSCGGWVKEVLDNNKYVQNILIIGVADHLVEELKDEVSQYGERVSFITENDILAWNDNASLCNRILDKIRTEWRNLPVYISIDKDALDKQAVVTNWDQGSLSLESLCLSVREIKSKYDIIGVDICGEKGSDMEFNDSGNTDSINEATNIQLAKLFLED